jgi:hypothetical protein
MEQIIRNYNEAIEEVFYWLGKIDKKQVSEYWGIKKMREAQAKAIIYDHKRNKHLKLYGC